MTDSDTITPLAEGGDPANFDVNDVNTYLARDLDDDERLRVLAAEENGRRRVGILGKPAESDAADATESAKAETYDVVLRQHWTDGDGKPRIPGETVTVDRATYDVLTTSTFGVPADGEGANG